VIGLAANDDIGAGTPQERLAGVGRPAQCHLGLNRWLPTKAFTPCSKNMFESAQ
jgi:hypothetical protein